MAARLRLHAPSLASYTLKQTKHNPQPEWFKTGFNVAHNSAYFYILWTVFFTPPAFYALSRHTRGAAHSANAGNILL
jgi:hypothetical protein